MNAHLLVIVPSRGRPGNAARVVQAWLDTGAFDDGAQLLFAIDADDPEHDRYLHALYAFPNTQEWLHLYTFEAWRPMVPKLNEVARHYAFPRPECDPHFALGFAGDDHLPRTAGWARDYIRHLRAVGTGVVSCRDGYREDELPTQWAMTSNIVRALGDMVPAPVDHLYCDDAVRHLAVAAGRYAYLYQHLIEHVHPVAGKAETDAQYDRVNSRRQYRDDRAAYRAWRDDPNGAARAVADVLQLVEKGAHRGQ